MNRVNLLWFDDDLMPRSEVVTPERGRLQTWLRYLKTGDRPDRICLIEVCDLATLRRELEQRARAPAGDAEHIDAFLIDVLWRQRGIDEWNFSEFHPAFKDESVLPLDAGAQLIGLMRNERYQSNRPAWCAAFDRHPFAVLTTLTDNRDTLERHIDARVLANIQILVKSSAGGDSLDPDPAFCTWIDGLQRRIQP